ncbi:MAG: OsmC family protein [Kangiellaceae bacterium]|nr:OsmC family protein [Kangiellaceae bacterium]
MSTEWQQRQKFTATTEQGDKIVMNGEGGAPSPMQLILAAVGGCSSIDVVMILEKGRHIITDCRCELTAERADAIPAVFTKINAHYIVTGRKIKNSAVQRACELSIEKYCSAALMLNKSVEITCSFEIKDSEAS